MVTEIKAGACKGMKNLETVTIGKNVEKIGAKAFLNCKNVIKFTIKTKKLTMGSVGKDAFKIGHNASYKCPSGMQEEYRELLIKKGAKKGSTFK